MRPWIACWFPLAAAGACSEQQAPPAAMNVVTAMTEAPAAAPSEAGPCEITGESTDTDPRGLRVRAEPSLAGRELGRLYPGIDPEAFFHDERPAAAEGSIGAQFTVDGAEGEWLHIADVDPVTDGVQLGDAPRLNFQGSGWVHASKVRLIFTTVAAHEAPDANSPIVAGARFANGYDARQLRDCRGRWAKLEYAPIEGESGGAPIEAWLLSHSNREHAQIMRNSLGSEGEAR